MGNFVIDGDGFLVDSNKNVVYGLKGEFFLDTGKLVVDESGVLAPIKIPMDGDELMNLSGISIDASGFVIGTNAANNVPSQIGMVALANVPNPNALEKTQGPYYKVVNNTGIVKPFKPGVGSTGKLLSNGLEMANVDLAKEFRR